MLMPGVKPSVDSGSGVSGKILIVDDDSRFCESTAELLEHCGHSCVQAQDVATATGLLKSEEFDLVIADVNLPDSSGIELIHAIQDLRSPVATIIVTGRPEVESAIEAVGRSVNAYLVKPIAFDVLKEEAEKGVSLARASRTFRQSFEHLKNLRGAMEAVLSSSTSLRKDSEYTVEFYFSHICNVIMGGMSDLITLFQAVGPDTHPSMDSLQLFNCPRMEAQKRLLKETVETLKETRTAFKSKQLGELRKKIEDFLEE
jgi:CheY-like chemotaxis protein